MRNYTRLRIPGGCYFFTINLAQRHGNDLLVRKIDALRDSFRQTRATHPFELDAIVVLPEHLHCIWQLPEGETNFSTRWRLIKARFSKVIPHDEQISESRERKGERGIWQRRFWEHLIRDDEDYNRHVDYIHYNPVKHGHCERPIDWPHSSFKRWVEKGIYSENWGANEKIQNLDWE